MSINDSACENDAPGGKDAGCTSMTGSEPSPGAGQAENPVFFGDLWVGDRFTAYNGLWTKVDWESARHHSNASRALASRGFGYIGDTLCNFEKESLVTFVPPRYNNVS